MFKLLQVKGIWRLQLEARTHSPSMTTKLQANNQPGIHPKIWLSISVYECRLPCRLLVLDPCVSNDFSHYLELQDHNDSSWEWGSVSTGNRLISLKDRIYNLLLIETFEAWLMKYQWGSLYSCEGGHRCRYLRTPPFSLTHPGPPTLGQLGPHSVTLIPMRWCDFWD